MENSDIAQFYGVFVKLFSSIAVKNYIFQFYSGDRGAVRLIKTSFEELFFEYLPGKTILVEEARRPLRVFPLKVQQYFVSL